MISYNDLFTQALNLYDKGNYTEAEGILRQLDNAAPDNPHILNLLGLIAQAKGIHHEACSYFAAAVRLNANSAEYYYNLAYSLQRCGEYHDALRNYQKVLSLRPEIKETYNEIACIYEALSQTDKAVEWWNKALQLFPDYATVAINLARCQNNYQQLLNLGQKFSQDYYIWYVLAQVEYKQDDFVAAENHINQALNICSSDADTNYLAGLIYEKLNNQTAAYDYFIKTEQLAPNHYDAKLKLADYYSRTNQFDQAETRYKRLIELNKADFAVHNNYAEMLYRQKRLPEALEEYRAAILIDPTSGAANNNLGAILKDLQEYDEALGLFFNALHYAPDMEEISLNIVETLVLLARDNKDKAIQIAANWLKSYPDNLYAEQINHALRGEKFANNNHYTEVLFNAFADNYELVMQNLDYSAPAALAKLKGSITGRVADLGCGSGLVGQAVKSVQNQIIGVDISAKMLSLAAAKNIYDELIKMDIIEFLKTRHDYDWIIAADVLGYIGDLGEFIKLCSGKKLIFTIEADDMIADYRLDITSRYKHNPAYVEKLLRDNGFNDIKSQKTTLRLEAGQPVNGVVFVVK